MKFLVMTFLLALSAQGSTYILDSSSFSVNSTLREIKGLQIKPLEGATRLVSEFPRELETGRFYLRRKSGNSYSWNAGQPVPNALRSLHAFSLKEKGLSSQKAVWLRFYGRRGERAFRDEQDIYFDRDFIYSARVPVLYYFLDGQWEEIRALEGGIGGFSIRAVNPLTVIFRGDTLGTTPMSIPAVHVGLHHVRLEAAGHLPWVTGFQVLPGQVINREVAIPVLEPTVGLLPHKADSVRISQSRDLISLEPLQDSLLVEAKVLAELEVGRRMSFEKSYPALVAAPPGINEWSDAGYIAYKESFLRARRDAMNLHMFELIQARAKWQASQNLLQSRLDSLHALRIVLVLKPEAMRVTLLDSITRRSRLDIKFRSPDGRHDAAWGGIWIDTLQAEVLARDLLDSAAGARLRIHFQNQPVRIVQGDKAIRRFYRYSRMEIEVGGVAREVVGAFVLPQYVQVQTEVQNWLAGVKPVVQTRTLENDSLREEQIRKQKQQAEKEALRARFRGEVVEIQGGKFRYRGKLVTISPFAIQHTEVTQEHFERITLSNPSTFKDAKKPVHQVDWTQARTFCQTIKGDLPTQAQWEFAARAGGEEGVSWTASTPVDEFAVHRDNAMRVNKKSTSFGPQSVASRRPNSYGLHDMAGNVAEWTQDRDSFFSIFVQSKDPQGSSVGHFRIFKGGSWQSSPRKLSAKLSDNEDPRYRSDYLGIRCVFPARQLLELDSLRKFLAARDSLAKAKGLVPVSSKLSPSAQVPTAPAPAVQAPAVPAPAPAPKVQAPAVPAPAPAPKVQAPAAPAPAQ